MLAKDGRVEQADGWCRGCMEGWFAFPICSFLFLLSFLSLSLPPFLLLLVF